ncbi:M48 family metallopeptidase [Lishizhenia sp.]|uniref:M48 family metallopeptidase n=1 Tax=Lishizhenia sp. TaxID=2497594 RepID=UPI00299D5199|nr:M48 family metallopeptidase [Lishizhenia sp.]MDX1445603.1 M48 family metallopeptidase [Lishizhenia sp.]
MNYNRLLHFAWFFVFVIQVQGQIDFNAYTPLQSSGEIPKKFTLTLKERVEFMTNNLRSSNMIEDPDFILNQCIAEQTFLNSGLVIYGDTLSQYIKDLAKLILKDDASLYDELDFYVLKTNECNAFMSGVGMLYITTGLLSQMSTESDLAFVIAHEVSHYQLRHSLNFHKETKDNKSLKFNDMAAYSKQQEFQADSLGLELFLKAGYKFENIDFTYDMLYYSYLPIDEVELEERFLFGENSVHSPHLITKEIKAIDFNQDYNDEHSSHPNIEKRKEYVKHLYKKLHANTKGRDLYKLGKQRFEFIRNLARFERVQNHLYSAEFAKCIYEINVLQQDYPKSKFLDISKALAFTNAAVAKVEFIDFMSDGLWDGDAQGNIVKVYHFLEKSSPQELLSYAMRHVVNTQQKYPNEYILNQLQYALLKLMARTNMNLKAYSKFSIKEILEEQNRRKQKTNPKDEQDIYYGYSAKEWKSLSKFEKIKAKQRASNTIEEVVLEEVDSNQLYLYVLPDLAIDDKVQILFNKAQEEYALEKERSSIPSKRYDFMVHSKKVYKKVKLDKGNIVLMTPSVYHVKNQEIDWEKSKRNQGRILKGYLSYSKNNDKVDMLSSSLLGFSTKEYNAKAALGRYTRVRQYLGNTEYINPDYLYFQDLQETLMCRYLLVSNILTHVNLDVDPGLVLLSLIPVGIPFVAYMGSKGMKARRVLHHMQLIDLKTGKIVKTREYFYSQRFTKGSVQLYVNDFIKN